MKVREWSTSKTGALEDVFSLLQSQKLVSRLLFLIEMVSWFLILLAFSRVFFGKDVTILRGVAGPVLLRGLEVVMLMM